MSNKRFYVEDTPLLNTDYKWMRDTNPKAIPIIYRRVKTITNLSICLSFFALGMVILPILTALSRGYLPGIMNLWQINNSTDKPEIIGSLPENDEHKFKNGTPTSGFIEIFKDTH